MIEQRATLLAAVCAVTVACLTAGCRPQLPPSEEAILYYFRAARVDGRVRRAWPQGQEYVDKVLKADAQLQEELDALREFETVHSLWPREDPRWRDEQELGQQIDKLVGVLEGGRSKREKSLRDLAKALEQVPADLNLAGDDEVAFLDGAWDALALQGTGPAIDVRAAPAQLGEPARLHLDLLRQIESGAGDLEADRSGLAFTDAARQERIDQQYDALRELLYGRREAFLEFAAQRITACRDRLETIDKRAERYEYTYLDDQEKYLRTALEEMPKKLAAMIEKLEKELGELEKEVAQAKPEKKAELEAKIDFRKGRIEQLSAEKKDLQARVDLIIKRPPQPGGD